MSLRITHFSDALCIWAFISQVRVAELREQFGADIVLDYRYFSVFGDIRTKMATQWRERGGLEGYAAHVREAAQRFEHVRLAEGLWLRNTPTSSLPAHLVLAAARIVAANDADHVLALDYAIRRAFFEQGRDVSQAAILLETCEAEGADVAAIERALQTGEAHAALAGDMKLAQEIDVRSSPTLTFNEGRQTLSGNVGYRVIEANVRELLRDPGDRQSWC